MDTDGHGRSEQWFKSGCAFELGLIVVGVALARVLGTPGLSAFRFDLDALGWGVAATVPLVVLLVLVSRSPWRPLEEIVEFMDSTLRPTLQRWSLLQFGILSALAGIGEELVFRGVMQTSLADRLGLWPSLLLTNLLFGACHWISPAYAALAASIGLYLGIVYAWTGNLLGPAVAHALYDLIALIYLTRLRR